MTDAAIEDVTDPACVAAPQKSGRPVKVRNGVAAPDPSVANLSVGQQLAVGALVEDAFGDAWANFCTGTLVAPDVVLTAAHCVSTRRGTISPDSVYFGIGNDMDAPLAVFAVESVHRHPSYASSSGDERYDFAVLKLEVDATREVPSLQPIGVNRTSVRSTIEGTRAQVGGYGQTHPDVSGNSRKYWTTELVDDVSSYGIAVDGNGVSAVCFGDSGGPLLRTSSDGIVRTYGVLSWGDETCLDVDHFGRVDTQLAWIESVAGPLPDPGVESPDAGTPDSGSPDAGSPDSGTPDAGSPDPGTPDAGMNGTPDAGTSTRPDAGPIDPGDACGPITWGGTCVGEIAVWCDDGELKAVDCDRCGRRCAFAGAELGFFCRD